MTRNDPAGFVHLHTHSEYSLLDGMGRIGDLVAAAEAAGQSALAITDHGSLAGTWKFAHACRAAGIKPILGAELYLSIGSRFDPQVLHVPRDAADIDGEDTDTGRGTDRDAETKRKTNEHLTVLAATATGWLNLVKITNAAQRTFRSKPLCDLALIKENAEGLIVLTGCLGGPVAGPLARGDLDTAERNLLALIDTVGPGNVYVEIMDHGIELESRVLKPLAELADAHGLTLVATNDAHYVHADDADTHEVWLASQSKSTLASEKRFRFNGAGYHLRTEGEMRALRPESRRWQDAVGATSLVADRIDDWVLPEVRYRMPRFALPDGFDTAEEYLHHLVLAGARQRYGSPLPAEVKQRLRHEEDVINSLGFAAYFLIVGELVGWARSQGILVGAGRGSASGSCTSYSLRITDVEPLAAKLLFERFLEQGRTDMPDIDVDFEQRRIPEIHDHLRQVYGADFVARLGTFAMARSKRAIKDAARVLGRSDLGTRMAALVPVDQGKPVGLAALTDPALAAGEEFRRLVASDGTAQLILDHARTVENAVLGAGIHACGVIVSGEPLTGLVPLRKDRQGANKHLPADQQPWVTDWDGKDTEALGLLKLDALFLRSLDVLAETSRIIAETTGEQVDFAADIDTADMSDPRVRVTWELLQAGRTSSVFQMEGAGMRELLVGARPASLDDLSAISALYRPGPLSTGMHERFVERRNGREQVDYGMYTDDPEEQKWLSTVLGTTSAVCIFQEQSMLLGTVVAGFDAAGRARMRRAIGKKKADVMAEVGRSFLEGAGREFRDAAGEVVSPVFSRATAERLWDMLKGSADYQFNKSHSFAYGKVTFLTAYAKANWPVQAAAAVLACTDDDGKRRRVLVDLAADGIEVAPPDINQGRATTSVGVDGRLRLGLAEIRDVGRAAELLIAEREDRGPFTSLVNLTSRMAGSSVSAKVFEALIEAGALDSFGPRLGLMMALRADVPLDIDAEWAGLERSERQRARLGKRVGAHPLAPHRDTLRAWRSDDGEHLESGTALGRRAVGVARLSKLDTTGKGRGVLVAGVLTRWDRAATSSGAMARFDIEGSDGSTVEGVMWNQTLRAQEVTGIPPLGSVVAVDGFLARRTIEVRVADSDGADIDARDAGDDASERIQTVQVLRLRADTLSRIELAEQDRLVLPAGRRIDLRAACLRGRELAAARLRSRGKPRVTTQTTSRSVSPTPAATLVDHEGCPDAAGTPSRKANPPRARITRTETLGAGTDAAAPLPIGLVAAVSSAGSVGSGLPAAGGPGAGGVVGAGLRWVMVGGDGGVRQWLVANSRDGLACHDTELALRRIRVVPKMFSEARSAPGTVFRYDQADGGQIFVVRHRIDDLPTGWWRTVFELIEDLTFSAEISLNREPVTSSATVLDLNIGPGGRAQPADRWELMAQPA